MKTGSYPVGARIVRLLLLLLLLYHPAARAQLVLNESILETLGILLRSDSATRFDTRLFPVINQGALAFVGQLETGDFNADGSVDLIAIVPGGQSILIRNEGNGAFLYGHEINDGGTVDCVFSNFDDDADDEIVIVDLNFSGVASLTVYDRLPSGTPNQSFTLGGFSDPLKLALGDINGDATPDVIVQTAGGFEVFQGNGVGGFSKLPTVEESALPGLSEFTLFLAARDLSGDDLADLLWMPPGGGIAFRKGNGDGTFQPSVVIADAISFDEQNFPALIDHGDDNDLDLLRFPLFGGDPGLLRNDGTGSFASESPLPGLSTSDNYSLLGIADRTNDRTEDIIVSTSESILSLEQNAAGDFEELVLASPTPGWAGLSSVSDLNNDGNVDIVIASRGGLAVLQADTEGTFPAAAVAKTGFNGSFFDPPPASGPLDGDGFADLASGGGTLYFGRADRTLDTLTLSDSSLNGAGREALMLDLDGIPLKDLVFLVGNRTSNDDVLQVWHQTSSRLFEKQAEVQINRNSRSLITGDFNGDTFADVALLHDDPASNIDLVVISFGDGAGGLGPPIEVTTPPNADPLNARIYPGRVNLDAADDIYFVHTAFPTGGFFPVVHVAVLAGGTDTAATGFLPPARVGGFSPVPVAVHDADADGRSELILVSGTSIRTVRPDDAGGLLNLSNSFYFPPASDVARVLLDDIDGDGLAELVATGEFPINVIERRGTGRYGPVGSYYIPLSNVDSITSGDYDGDGRVDLAIVDSSGSEIALLYQRTPSLLQNLADDAGVGLSTTGLGQRLDQIGQVHGEEFRRLALADARDAAFPFIGIIVEELAPALISFSLTGSTQSTVTARLADAINGLLDVYIAASSTGLGTELQNLKQDLDATSKIGLPLELALTEIGGTTFRIISVFWLNGTFNVTIPFIPQTAPILERYDESTGWLPIVDTGSSITDGINTVTDPSPDGPKGIYRVTLQPE